MPDDEERKIFTGEQWTMRAPCGHCGITTGTITTKNGQDIVECGLCRSYQYAAPKEETGRGVRRAAPRRRPIRDSRRWRVLDRFGHTCISCGRAAGPDVGEFHIAHLVAIEDATAFGFNDDIIDSDFNLVPMCPECNLGQVPFGSVSIQLLYRALVIHETKQRESRGDAA